MDERKRMELEAKLLDHMQRAKYIQAEALENIAQRPKYVAVKVFLRDERFLLAALDDGPTTVTGLEINAVAAVTMAIDILELAQKVFPGMLNIQADRAPPEGSKN